MEDGGVVPAFQGDSATSPPPVTYPLLRGCAIVTVSEDNHSYHISLAELSLEENDLLATVRADISAARKENPHVRFSKKDWISLIQEHAPDIEKKRGNLIYSWCCINADPVRWIRVILTDPKVKIVECRSPGRAATIRLVQFSGRFQTNIILDAKDLSRLAAFFTRQVPGLKMTNPLIFTLPGGWQITIIWKTDAKSPAIQVKKQNPRNSGILPDEQRTDAILAEVFRDGKQPPVPGATDEKANSGTGKLPEKKKNGILYPLLRYNLKNLLHKEEPEPEPAKEESDVTSVLEQKEIGDRTCEEIYWLDQPHSYVAVLQDKQKERAYQVYEPELTSRERIVLEETHETLRDVLVYDQPVGKGDLFLRYDEVTPVIKTYDPILTDDRLAVLYYYLKRNLSGYGKIEPLMHDELLEDISCNGHDLPVYVQHRYYGSMPTSIIFESDELNRFVLKLAQKADKQVSLTNPLLDAALPNGSRAQLTYSDVVSTKGSSFTIRKFRTDPMTPVTLLGFGTYDAELLALIWLCLENRKSLIVVGGTASGKTSAMNAFSFFIPHNSKIVSLEDTREIQIPHKNWLPAQTRESGAVNDRGSIDLFDLLKASLRQRPEYIIVGEVRGSEAQTLFQAMNSGHTTLSTLHAGTIQEALNRLTNEPINVPAAMFGALDLMVIQTFHYKDGVMIRRCDAIHEILLGKEDKVGWNTLYEYQPGSDSFARRFTESKVLKSIQYMHNWSDAELAWQLQVREEFLKRVKSMHHIDPAALMQMITLLRRRA